MDRVCVVVAELMHDFSNSIMVAFSEGGSDGSLETVRVLRQLCSTSFTCIHCSDRLAACTSYAFLASGLQIWLPGSNQRATGANGSRV